LARTSFLLNGRACKCAAAASLETIFAFIGLALFAARRKVAARQYRRYSPLSGEARPTANS